MDILREYTRQIALYLIFDFFIGIILPNEKYKKYISLVSGFILILIMLSPIQKFFSLADNFFLSHKNNFQNKISIYKDIKEIYLKQIKNIAENAGLKIDSIEVYIKNQDSDQIFIENIKIKLMDGDESEINKFRNTLCLFYGLESKDINIS